MLSSPYCVEETDEEQMLLTSARHSSIIVYLIWWSDWPTVNPQWMVFWSDWLGASVCRDQNFVLVLRNGLLSMLFDWPSIARPSHLDIGFGFISEDSSIGDDDNGWRWGTFLGHKRWNINSRTLYSASGMNSARLLDKRKRRFCTWDGCGVNEWMDDWLVAWLVG